MDKRFCRFSKTSYNFFQHLEVVIKSRIPGLQSLITKTISELETELSRLGKPVAADAGVSNLHFPFFWFFSYFNTHSLGCRENCIWSWRFAVLLIKRSKNTLTAREWSLRDIIAISSFWLYDYLILTTSQTVRWWKGKLCVRQSIPSCN